MQMSHFFIPYTKAAERSPVETIWARCAMIPLARAMQQLFCIFLCFFLLTSGLQVSSPQAGVVLQKSQAVTIEWYYDGFFSDVFLDLYAPDGTWVLRIADAPALTDDASYLWTVPAAVPAGQYFIMVTSDCYAGCDNGNSSIFSIEGPCSIIYQNSSCPTNDPRYVCSYHGSCNPNGTCTCNYGFSGVDCSELYIIGPTSAASFHSSMLFSYWASTNQSYAVHQVQSTSWNNPIQKPVVFRSVQTPYGIVSYLAINFTVNMYVAVASTPPAHWSDWWNSEPNCTDPTLGQYGCFHAGFLLAAHAIWNDYKLAFPKMGALPMVIQGHGTGGAIAVLLTMLMRVEGDLVISGVITYGQPAVAFTAWDKTATLFQLINLIRIINGPDPIPRLPAGALHFGAEIHWLRGGNYTILTGCIAGTMRPEGWVAKVTDILDDALASPFWCAVMALTDVLPYVEMMDAALHGNLLSVVVDVADVYLDLDTLEGCKK